MCRILSTVILSLWASIAFALQMTPPSGGDSFTNPRTGDSYSSTGSAVSIDQADVSYAFSRGWVTASQPTVGSSPVTTIVLPANVVGDCAKWITPTQAGDSGGACGGGAGAITLQTNGTNNASQTALNIESGNGIACSNPSAGNVQCSANAPERTVTAAADTISCTTDNNGLVIYNSASAVAVTIPQATGSCSPSSGFLGVTVINIGAGAVTLTPTTSTINGLASITAAQYTGGSIVSNGTNYVAASCTACVSGGSSAFNSITTGTNTTATMIVGTGALFGIQGSSTGYSTFATANTGAANYTITFPSGTGSVPFTGIGNSWYGVQAYHGPIQYYPTAITSATSITPNCSSFEKITASATGTFTINAPSCAPAAVDGQMMRLKITSPSGGNITYSWNAVYIASATLALPTTSNAASKEDYFEFQYDADKSGWVYLRGTQGF